MKCKILYMQLVLSLLLPHDPPQLYGWQRLPRILCDLAGILYKVPQDIFYGGENSQVQHIITRVLKHYFQTSECLLRISTILTVNICQVLVEMCLLRSLLHPALTR